jgi:hypothetical protein
MQRRKPAILSLWLATLADTSSDDEASNVDEETSQTATRDLPEQKPQNNKPRDNVSIPERNAPRDNDVSPDRNELQDNVSIPEHNEPQENVSIPEPSEPEDNVNIPEHNKPQYNDPQDNEPGRDVKEDANQTQATEVVISETFGAEMHVAEPDVETKGNSEETVANGWFLWTPTRETQGIEARLAVIASLQPGQRMNVASLTVFGAWSWRRVQRHVAGTESRWHTLNFIRETLQEALDTGQFRAGILACRAGIRSLQETYPDMQNEVREVLEWLERQTSE